MLFESLYLGVVDFPLLKVLILPDKVSLSFSHPYHVHNVESLNEKFLFTVSTNKVRSEIFLFLFYNVFYLTQVSNSVLLEPLSHTKAIKCTGKHNTGYATNIHFHVVFDKST